MTPIRHVSIKFLLVLIPTAVACVVVFTVLFILVKHRQLTHEMTARVIETSRLHGHALAEPLYRFNFEAVRRNLDAFSGAPEILCVEVVDLVTGSTYGWPDDACAKDRAVPDILLLPIRFDAQDIGLMRIVVSADPIRVRLYQEVESIALVCLIMVAITIVTALAAFRGTVGVPLERLLQSMRETGSKTGRGISPPVVQWNSADELGQVVAAYNDMIGQVENRTRALAQSEEHLRSAKERAETALGELKAAQKSLVQAEKMSALGMLVAGVAHEINTPVGIGVTAASYLAERTQQFRTAFEAGQLRRSVVQDYVTVALESTGLVLSNLERASELVMNFKQVAVDQVSGERRCFNLRRFIDGLLVSLTPHLRPSPHRLRVDCPDDIELDSYPGALSQIITNLVFNALVHAFDDGTSGLIVITAVPSVPDVPSAPDGIILTIADDGRGIPPENLPRIFDPFFTTRRGAGGTGLGLHVVFNSVTGALGGHVNVESHPGNGTRFILTLPTIAPSPADTSLKELSP